MQDFSYILIAKSKEMVAKNVIIQLMLSSYTIVQYN